MSRSGDPKELLGGPLMFTLVRHTHPMATLVFTLVHHTYPPNTHACDQVMNTLGLFFFKQTSSALAMAALGA